MPPRSPLPARHGLSAAWVRTPDRDPDAPAPWTTMGGWLAHRLPEHVDVPAMLAAGRFVHADAAPVRADEPYRPHTFVWFHRDLREEPAVPGRVQVLHRDERLVVVDKPPFLSSIPRGRHVAQSAVVRLRAELGLPELAPAHRLDRLTSGVLMLTTERRWRGPYQSLFEQRAVAKVYTALAPLRPHLAEGAVLRSHIRKQRGVLQAEELPGAPANAETRVELVEARGELAVYRLHPLTGRTHQLRLQLCSQGAPIVGDPLYPEVRDVDVDDFTAPLQLLAAELSFTDPVDGRPRRFTSSRRLPV